jgi:hypothetical protein
VSRVTITASLMREDDPLIATSLTVIAIATPDEMLAR